jgi:hypothetical protein
LDDAGDNCFRLNAQNPLFRELGAVRSSICADQRARVLTMGGRIRQTTVLRIQVHFCGRAMVDVISICYGVQALKLSELMEESKLVSVKPIEAIHHPYFPADGVWLLP